MTEVRSQRLQYERLTHADLVLIRVLRVRRYDRLDDAALTNVDNSEPVPGESHDQQWLVLIWVTWSQGPEKWAAVTFPLGTRAVWAGTADAAVCAIFLVCFIVLFVQHLLLSEPSQKTVWFQVLMIWAKLSRVLALKSLQRQYLYYTIQFSISTSGCLLLKLTCLHECHHASLNFKAFTTKGSIIHTRVLVDKH